MGACFLSEMHTQGTRPPAVRTALLWCSGALAGERAGVGHWVGTVHLLLTPDHD